MTQLPIKRRLNSMKKTIYKSFIGLEWVSGLWSFILSLVLSILVANRGRWKVLKNLI
jgi:hypothetical protein